jgi:site-specific DNA-methyltransferase (adenine-specific)
MSKTKLLIGDNIKSLKKLPDNSVDSIVSDPPYGLSFMGKKWDYDVPSVEFWQEVYRVLKPGGHVLSFGGTRTYHRMVVNIEDAGFEIRDQIMWLYGSGFPKSHNIGKAVDKLQGNEREVVGEKLTGMARHKTTNMMIEDTKGSSPYEGWGTALKPANEPICVARKPISEKSVAQNVLKWGTGGINIDGCRVGISQEDFETNIKKASKENNGVNFDVAESKSKGTAVPTNPEGRFPANIILDEIAGEVLDEQSGSGASRFFYQAKVSKVERNMALDVFEEKETNAKNTHPTVKPVALMAYLCRLVTPPNGIVLDPFMGSGSTGIAARLEGFKFCGMELDEDYFKIASARIENYEEYRKFIK